MVALYNDEPVGVCALTRTDRSGYDFELVKMAVAPKAQGKSIGWLLGEAIIKTAREMGASKISLEGNTRLEASISLYQKLGLKKVAGGPSPYRRVNIQMEADLSSQYDKQ